MAAILACQPDLLTVRTNCANSVFRSAWNMLASARELAKFARLASRNTPSVMYDHLFRMRKSASIRCIVGDT